MMQKPFYRYRLRLARWLAVAGLACGLAVRADPLTWTGLVDDDWFTAGNWDPERIPADGETVIIAAGTVLLTNASAELAAFTMTGGTLTFSNWTTRLRADAVVLQNGTLTLPPAFTNHAMSNRIWIVCQDFTLDADARIDADGKGYAKLNGPGAGMGLNTHGSGGGYGGRGGHGNYNLTPGMPYGSAETPEDPGSGGGGYGQTHGGGAIRIEATGDVIIHGVVTANGATPSGTDGRDGGGSGGAVYITCQTFGGTATGLMSVRGGFHNAAGTAGGGGGGGRIAVHYQELGNPAAVRMSASRSPHNYEVVRLDTQEPFACMDGTIWLSNADLLTAPLMSGIFDRGVLVIPGFEFWTVADLVLSNTAFRIGYPDFQLRVANDLRVIGADVALGATNGFAALRIGGNLALTNGAVLSIFSGANSVAGYGALLSVTGDITVASQSWIYPYSHPTNGASPLIEAHHLMIASNGGINANNRGFHGQMGAGTGWNGWHDAGGSYGGLGEFGTYGRVPRPVYGSISAPDLPGSGGGGGGRDFFHPSPYGGAGGGLVRIALRGDAVVDGLISADGGPYAGNADGAGSGAGGGIHLQCRTFGGGPTGRLSVRGGNNPLGRGGAGGGGRIAVDYQHLANDHQVRFDASPGSSWFTNPRRMAAPGTLWMTTPELLTETLDDGRFMNVRFHAPGFDAWTVAHLAISNSAVVFGEDGFRLHVTGELTIGTNGVLGIGAISGDARPMLTCGGNLTVLGGGALHVYAGRTNGVEPGIGATVDVGGDLRVETGGWIVPHAHALTGGGGGVPRFRARSLTVAEQGGFNAQGLGYRFQHGPGAGLTASSGGRGGGGGYGGAGGSHSYAANSGGLTNGLELASMQPGSGGGWAYAGGDGGGVVWLDIAETVELKGEINADGFGFIGDGGGGAGGGVLISAMDVRAAGTAVVRASGGAGRTGNGGGGGGGGRIAVWRKLFADERDLLLAGHAVGRLRDRISEESFSRFQATPVVDGGAGWENGQPGTVRFINGTPRGMLVIVR